MTETFLDVLYPEFTFRLHIFHPSELTSVASFVTDGAGGTPPDDESLEKLRTRWWRLVMIFRGRRGLSEHMSCMRSSSVVFLCLASTTSRFGIVIRRNFVGLHANNPDHIRRKYTPAGKKRTTKTDVTATTKLQHTASSVRGRHVETGAEEGWKIIYGDRRLAAAIEFFGKLDDIYFLLCERAHRDALGDESELRKDPLRPTFGDKDEVDVSFRRPLSNQVGLYIDGAWVNV